MNERDKGRMTLAEKINAHLFKGESNVVFNAEENILYQRYFDVYSQMLEKPWTEDKEWVNYLLSHYNIDRSQAYRDLAKIKGLLSNVKSASKEFVRFMVFEACKKALTETEKEKDWKNFILAIDKLGKYFRLDENDPDEINWSKVYVQDWAPTLNIREVDPNYKGPEDSNAWRAKMRKKFGQIDEAQILPTDE